MQLTLNAILKNRYVSQLRLICVKWWSIETHAEEGYNRMHANISYFTCGVLCGVKATTSSINSYPETQDGSLNISISDACIIRKVRHGNQHEIWLYKTTSFQDIYTFYKLQATSFYILSCATYHRARRYGGVVRTWVEGLQVCVKYWTTGKDAYLLAINP